MKKITHKQLIELFLNPVVSGISGTSFIGLDTLTDVTLKGGRSNEMQGGVQKATIGSSVMVFQNKKENGYANMVRRRLEAEGKNPDSFELGSRKWGVRIDNTPLVEHKGEYYLEVIFLKAGETMYFFNSKPIKKDLITGLETEKAEGVQGGVENKVITRTYKIGSLVRVTINKEVYLISE